MHSTPIRIYQAAVDDAPIINELVQRLLAELGGFHRGEQRDTVAFCAQLLASDHYTAFLASDANNVPLGVLTLNEVSALYVAGRLGWIQELYVAPAARSLGVGQQLLTAAVAYGRQRGWQRLEVNTPDADAWPRTVAFYRREGFLGGSYHLRMPL
jgi:GNAT superfamily N-acetyltransferase